MTTNRRLVCGAVLASLGLTGCGPAALPYPTEKKVSLTQIVGKWRYHTDYKEVTVTLELRDNGSFVQSIPASSLGRARVQKGHWSLDGSWLHLDQALRYKNDHWQPTGYTCWVIDGDTPFSPFTLFGGDGFQDDPDSGDFFERVS